MESEKKLKKRVVITGRGIINPIGNDISQFHKNLFEFKNGILPIDKYTTAKNLIKVGGVIQNFKPTNINKRLNRKIDTFIRYALLASEQAIKESGFKNYQHFNPYRTGVFVGNNSGGWDISERGFKELYKNGPDYVNPWQATAWFPAASQGYITITNKFYGYSKSFVADRSSSAMSLKFAYDSIMNDFNDIVVCGGTEAPISKLSTICYSQTNELYTGNSTAYNSLEDSSEGIILGEGSSFLIIEELQHALNRGAPIFGEIVGISTNIGDYQECINDNLKKSNINYKDIDVFMPEACGVKESDDIEKQFIDDYILDNTNISIPKKYFGHLYGASTTTDIVTATLFLENSSVIGNYRHSEGIVNKNIDNILITSSSKNLNNVSILLKKYGG